MDDLSLGGAGHEEHKVSHASPMRYAAPVAQVPTRPFGPGLLGQAPMTPGGGYKI